MLTQHILGSAVCWQCVSGIEPAFSKHLFCADAGQAGKMGATIPTHMEVPGLQEISMERLLCGGCGVEGLRARTCPADGGSEGSACGRVSSSLDSSMLS